MQFPFHLICACIRIEQWVRHNMIFEDRSSERKRTNETLLLRLTGYCLKTRWTLFVSEEEKKNTR